MERFLPLDKCSIKDIYMDGQETIIYKIPVYQRNYAWEEDEITDLIKDVYDSLCSNKPQYYIGTLVTYKRGDNEYEVIDGQQRLTTIYLILKALGIKNIRNKLTYSARKVSAQTIAHLPEWGEEYDKGIRNGFFYAQKAIHVIISEQEKAKFMEYFLNNVLIIHYKVPKDVDLNHYFEVMNSRGEQLEKHEIVKALLAKQLDGQEDLATFCKIWEACSEMNVYIQQVLEEKELFGSSLNDFLKSNFDEIPKEDTAKDKQSIRKLLGSKIQMISGSEELAKTDKFQPIIDFPNFLLIVLKLTLLHDYQSKKTSTIVLDDKELLSEFQKTMDGFDNVEKRCFVKLFIFNLLKAKFFLDNYVIHHIVDTNERVGDNPWKLQYYFNESTSKKYTKNLSDNLDIQKELVQLLSMFEVSFSSKQRKNYLFYCLAYLFDNKDVKEYLIFMQRLADKYLHDVYLNKDYLNERNQPKPNAFDCAILQNNEIVTSYEVLDINYAALFEEIFQPGRSDIPLFVFNYTDYKIWKKYADDLKGNKILKGSDSRKQFFEELGCSDFDLEPFTTFYFSRTRKSLEHFYPQSKVVKDDEASEATLSVSQINCFGNFAMIGAEANSSGSNWDPKAKLNHYLDGKANPVSVASLKFKIMMQKCKDNEIAMNLGTLRRLERQEWNFEDIKIHQAKMIHIIFPTVKK